MKTKRTYRGLFITFEGGDGVGKSTQVKRLGDYLRNQGHTVLETREPGGAPGAEIIRELLVTGAADRWTPMAEALMMYAARAEHLEKTIVPALEHGEIVLCDRFSDSTMAYQGHAGSIGTEKIKDLYDVVVGENYTPDLTYVLHISSGEGIKRAKTRNDAEHRFEDKGDAYHLAVEQAFIDIANSNPNRCILIDANGDKETVTQRLVDALQTKFSITQDAVLAKCP